MTYSVLELSAVNSILASIGQAPVTHIDAELQPAYPTNPDVAMAYNTLMEVSREVQSEGWTFNQERHYPLTLNADNEIDIPQDIIQMNLTTDEWVFYDGSIMRNHYVKNYIPEVCQRNKKLYDKANHTYKFNMSPIFVDLMWLYEFDDIPTVVRDYIVARASTIACMRMIGDSDQYQMLQQRELYTRAQAIEYETTQGEYSFFGKPQGGYQYNGYQPYKTLIR